MSAKPRALTLWEQKNGKGRERERRTETLRSWEVRKWRLTALAMIGKPSAMELTE